MPTFQITDPNSGRTLRVTGDSPPSQQEMEQLFSQFQVSTVDTDSELRAQLAEEQAAELGGFEAAAVGAGRGLTTILRGLGISDPEDPVVTQAFEELKSQRPISTTVGEIAGEAAPFLAAAPLAGAGLATSTAGRVLIPAAKTIGQRVAGSAALGATEGAIISKGLGGDDVQASQAGGLGGAIAGGAELVLPRLSRIGGKLIRRINGSTPTAPVLNAAGQPSAELADALEKAGLSFDDLGVEAQRLVESGDVDDVASLARQSFLEEQGVVPTRAQVTGEASDFQAQQELAKTSGRVRRALEGQESVLVSRFENAVTQTGGSANRSSSPAIDFVADRSIDLDAAISTAYKQAREAASDQQVVSLTGLSQSIKDIAGSDRATGGLASATRDILRTRGILGGKGLKVQGRIDPATAEEVRKDMNALFDSLTPFGRSKLATLKNALDLDVERAVGEDVFAGARSAKAEFEKDLRRAKVNKFDSRKKNLVRDILENKVNPDRFLNEAVLSNSIRSTDLEQVKRFLQIDGDGPGIDAWNDLRAEAMQHIRDTAFKEVAGEPALSRAGLEKVLFKDFGRDKLRVLFSQDERKFLNDMLKVTKLREPKRGTALGKGPSAQAVGQLENVIKRIPLVAGVFEGLATDTAGRVSLRQPRLVNPVQPISGRAGSAVAPAAALLSTTATAEESQQ